MAGPRSPRSAGGVALTIGVLLLVPLVALVATALVTFDAGALLHLARTVLAETVEVTALLAAGALAGSVALGVGCAWCVERYEFPWRRTLAWMLVLPLAMPTYVIAYAYTDLLQYSGPVQRWMRVSLGFEGRLPDIRSITGAVVLFSFVLYPYVYLITRTAIAEVSGSAVESARLLGQSRWKVFFRVVRPLIMPSIVAFISSIGESMLASTALIQSSRDQLRKSPGGGPPALLTRMSTAGQAASACARPSGVVMSPATATTFAPVLFLISSAVASSASLPRAVMTRFTPSRARAMAQPLPRPFDAAQTSAFLPLIPMSMVFSLSSV